ncbi:MAG: hypothetical protein K5765_06825 [Clostridia bacterium]|nr:hypothetical protein [Clostridia bacterium]
MAKKSIMDRIKTVNFKRFARGFAIVWMIIFIIVMTITNVGIDKSFDWIKWLGNAMILFGITVFGLLMGESIGVDMQKEKIVRDDNGKIVGGLFQKNLFDYNVFREAIDPIIIYFHLFYDWIIPQRLESKQVNFLIMNDVNPKKAKKIVLYCTDADLFNLKNGAIKKVDEYGKEIYIDKLSAHEYEPVEEVLTGHVKLELSGTAYYLQAFAESSQRDILEQGEVYKRARKYNKTSSRAVRLVSGAVISLALGILTVNDFMRGNDAQAWMNLVTRITNLFTGLFSGWLSGAVDVKLEANAIENKTDVLKLFKSAYEKHLFELYDEDALAKKNYERQEQEKKEAEKNVIIPEVMEEKNLIEHVTETKMENNETSTALMLK